MPQRRSPQQARRRRRRRPPTPRRAAHDFCSTPPASCSPARTTAAPRRVRSPRAQASPNTCCSATSAPRPDCSGRRWYFPFTNIVDEFAQDVAGRRSRGDRRRRTGPPFRRAALRRSRRAPGALLTLVASEALSEEEIADAGIADIRRALRVLGQISVGGHAVARDAVEPTGPARALDDGDDRRHGGDCVRRSSDPSRPHATRSSTNSSRRRCTASSTDPIDAALRFAVVDTLSPPR